MPIKVSDPRSFEAIVQQKEESDLLEHDEFLVLWNRWNESKDPRLFDRIFNANLRMAYRLAVRGSFKYKIDVTDAYQVACIALMRAIRKFKPETGRKLITYAWSALKRGIEKEASDGHVLRVEKRVADKVRSLDAVYRELTQSLGRMPTQSELMDRLEWTEKELSRIEQVRHSSKISSLDAPVGLDGDSTVRDVIPALHQSQWYIPSELKERIVSISKGLNERERALFIHRYVAPLLGREALNFKQLAAMFRVTKQRMQIIDHALRERLKTHYHLKV